MPSAGEQSLRQAPPAPISPPAWQRQQAWQQPWQPWQHSSQSHQLLSSQPPATGSDSGVAEAPDLTGKSFRSIQELEEAILSRSRGGSVDEAERQADEESAQQKSSLLPPPPPPPLQPEQQWQPQHFQGALPMQTGIVRRLFPGKGFGFVARDDGGRGARHGRGDVFLHFSDLEPGVGSAELAVGARVRFHWEETADPQRGPGGRARRVSLMEDVPEQLAAGAPQAAGLDSEASLPSSAPSAIEASVSWPSSLPTPAAAAVSSGATPAPRPRAAGRVYRREALLACEATMRRWGQLRGPRPQRVPRTLRLPSWCWDDDDGYNSEDDAIDDEARLRALEARLDRENGADLFNGETFGEAWAGEAWTFEEALEANERLAADQRSVAAGLGTPSMKKMDTQVTEFSSSVDNGMLVSTTSSEDGEEEKAKTWGASGRSPVELDPSLVLQ
eukprot:TRINITY_DN40499_c0_g1_i1.p1 TRINITY_DN40499_c0_g1~~TRINITY_DN40499_c0_g1_i1.p1  ORF type:complete len:517 (-),score=133.53 TRINITY_DN40499_c0_g1_i1:116-1450(-)